MTIQSQTYDISYTGNGATTVFAYNFKILSNTDLKVYVDNVLQTLTTNYTVSGVGVEGGGNVTFVTAPADALNVYIARNGMAYTQLTDYVEGDNFPAETHEAAIDKVTLLLQQVLVALSKTIKLPFSETLTTTLAAANTRANSYLKFDADGNLSYDDITEPTDTFMQAGTGAVTRTYQSKNRDIVNAKDFGCLGDGVTDDTANLIKSVAYCKNAHKTLSLEGCICLVSSTIDVTGLTLDGGGKGLDGGSGAYDAYPNIKATSAQFNVLQTSGSTTIRDFTIDGGWDTVTTGQNGCGIYTTYQPYDLHFIRVRVIKAKNSGIYLNHAGYTNFDNVKCYGCGLHGLEVYGTSANDAATTVAVGGFSVFTGMVNGVGVKLTNAINCNFADCIAEGNSSGISLNGDCRNLKFDSFYQENIDDEKFLTWNSSAGQGLIVQNCFYPNGTVDDYINWYDVHFIGNTLDTPPIWGGAFTSFINFTSNEIVQSTTGSYTYATINLGRGTWQIYAMVQTISSVNGEMNRLACQVTSDVTDSGENNTTNNTYNILANTVSANTNSFWKPPVNPIDTGDLPATFEFEDATQTGELRVAVSGIYQQETAGNVYLRVYLNIKTGSVGTKATFQAVNIARF
jgi:hypothetical protein